MVHDLARVAGDQHRVRAGTAGNFGPAIALDVEPAVKLFVAALHREHRSVAMHARLRARRSGGVQLARPAEDNARPELGTVVKGGGNAALVETREHEPRRIGPRGGEQLLRGGGHILYTLGQEPRHFTGVERAALALPEAVRLDHDRADIEKSLRPAGAVA